MHAAATAYAAQQAAQEAAKLSQAALEAAEPDCDEREASLSHAFDVVAPDTPPKEDVPGHQGPFGAFLHASAIPAVCSAMEEL